LQNQEYKKPYIRKQIIWYPKPLTALFLKIVAYGGSKPPFTADFEGHHAQKVNELAKIEKSHA